MDQEVKFTGTVVRCIYQSDDYRIYALDVDKEKYPDIKHNKYKNTSICGELPELSEGMTYEVTAIEQQGKYGYSYKVSNIRQDVLRNSYDMYLFLQEILTPNQADQLWEHYPDIVQRVKENRLDDVDLNKLKGIKEATFAKIVEKITENYCLADLVIEFQGYFTLSMIKRLYQVFSSVELLKQKLSEEPYLCLTSISGIGFKTADTILLDLEKISKDNIKKGKPPIIEFEGDLRTSSQRCLACLVFLLQENENNGHTKMNLADLRSQCIKLVPACADHFVEVIKHKWIYYNKDSLDVALKWTYETEKYIAETIINTLKSEQIVWQFDIDKYRDIGDISLSDEQMNAIRNVCKYNISILNGFGGSGKTFSTQAIIRMLEDNNISYRLFAPTGRAAKVLAAYTNRSASTIHRGLGYMPVNNWHIDKEHKLHTDIVIVDEFSMVDVNLFSHLIDGIDFKCTKLLIVGDSAQLPSVGCGNLLQDFMTTKIIPTTTLTKIFRYSEGGLMKIATDVRMCKPYLNNSMKNTATSFGNNKDYVYIDMPSDKISKNVVVLYKKLLEAGYSIEDIQVLSAKNVGECGSDQLNNLLQKVANRNYMKSQAITMSETSYYRGDLVIQIVNNYKAEIAKEYPQSKPDEVYKDTKTGKDVMFIANGETGIVDIVEDSSMVINFDGMYVRYSKAELKMIKLGYCISVHKSQGGSCDNIILCTPQSHSFLLSSNLLYVGLTRMKKHCYHLGTIQTINRAVMKKANYQRNTFMEQLLKEGVTNVRKNEKDEQQ